MTAQEAEADAGVFIPPPPTVARQEMSRKEMDSPEFPRSPKGVWKAARAADEVRARVTSREGPWLSRTFRNLLAENAQTMSIARAAPWGKVWAMWLSRDGEKWGYECGWQVEPELARLSGGDLKKWIKGEFEPPEQEK